MSVTILLQLTLSLICEFQRFKYQVSYLEIGPLMWMMPLHLHGNKKPDYEDDEIKCGVAKRSVVA